MYLEIHEFGAVVVILSVLWAGCGLFESPLGFQGLRDGDACGPDKMGKFSEAEGECDLGSLREVVQASAAAGSLVFVHPDGENGADGSKVDPFGSVSVGIRAAQKRGADAVVIAGDETYVDRIELKNGVSVVGGWDESWSEATKRPTIVSERGDGEGQNSAIVGVGLRERTYLRNLVVESTGEGRTKYGARLVDVQGLQVENTVIRAGVGKAGADGADGAPGADGTTGKNGGQPDTESAGARGKNPDCLDAEGGAGGRGGFEGNSGSREGAPGDGSAASVQGGGPSENGYDGAAGGDGSSGADGENGAVEDGRWLLGGDGARGADGTHGEGGGGGGGGRVSGGTGIGGGGGGGGAGGCAGQGGEGGGAGGASIGMLLVDSSVALRNSDVVGSDAGRGGAGGSGGPGGEGARGGVGAQGTDAGERGGDGGAGGAGGAGGDGGDGRGGVSFGIYCVGESEIEREETNVQVGRGGEHGGDLSGRAESKKSKGCEPM